jgi:hypothetical protein
MSIMTPSGDVVADTLTLSRALYDAAVSGDPIAFSGLWLVDSALVRMPDVYSQLVIRGDATFQLVDRSGAAGWGAPLVIELGKSNGGLLHIEDGLTFSGGGSMQSKALPAASQHSCLRITRNHYLDPDKICSLQKLQIDNLSVTDRISIGLAFGASSDLQWIREAHINGGHLSDPSTQYPRAHIEFGSSVAKTVINDLSSTIDGYVQTEPERDTGVTETVIRNSTCGTWEFGGRAEQQRYELHNCDTLRRLNLNTASYLVRGGKHRLEKTVGWYRSNVDVEGADFTLADDAQIVIYHALSGVPDVQLTRRFSRCSFKYENPDSSWRAPSRLGSSWNAMIRVTPSRDANIHGIRTEYNTFDPRCYTSIYAVGTSLNSYRDKVAGEHAFALGEFGRFGGNYNVHAEDGDQTAVRGSPLFFNADVPTAPMVFHRSGDGWRPGVSAGQSVIDEHAYYFSSAKFYGDKSPVGTGGVKGDEWFYGGKAWRATRTSVSDAEWVETS